VTLTEVACEKRAIRPDTRENTSLQNLKKNIKQNITKDISSNMRGK